MLSLRPAQHLYEISVLRAMRRELEKRLLILPIAWATFGLGLVYGLRFLLGPIANIVPTVQNDKPIGGAIFPVLFYSVAMVLGVLSVSLYSVGVWNPDFSKRKDRADLTALTVLIAGGLLLWYMPIAFVFVIGA